nr:MAG TPA: hypothetical protein [Caudoviricetes sp.]
MKININIECTKVKYFHSILFNDKPQHVVYLVFN